MERGVLHTSTIRKIQKEDSELHVRLTPNFLNLFNDSILENCIYSRLFGLQRSFLNDKNLTIILSVLILINENKKCSLNALKLLYEGFVKKLDCCKFDAIADYMDEYLNQSVVERYKIHQKPWF